jgi:hypothetical protein
VDEKQVNDWQSVAKDYRDRVTHILGVLGVIAGYGLVKPAYDFAQQLGVGPWWEPLVFWVLVPFWILGIGVLSMKAPRVVFWGLPKPYVTLATLPASAMNMQQKPPTKKPSREAMKVAARILVKRGKR